MTRDEVIKGLERCMGKISCNGCPLECAEGDCALTLLSETIALLKDGDMVRVVRCAECEHWEPSNAEEGDYSGRCRNRGPCQNQQTDGTWFCGDGAKMEVDA